MSCKKFRETILCGDPGQNLVNAGNIFVDEGWLCTVGSRHTHPTEIRYDFGRRMVRAWYPRAVHNIQLLPQLTHHHYAAQHV